MAIQRVEIRGLKETQKRLEETVKGLTGGPMYEAMRDSTLMVERAAKQNAPVDTGRLRASITPAIRLDGSSVVGVVGSNVTYAPYVELGTRPHFPPPTALMPWVRRKLHISGGFGLAMAAYALALKIARRGTRATRFLQRAFEDNRTRIDARFQRAVRELAQRANGGGR